VRCPLFFAKNSSLCLRAIAKDGGRCACIPSGPCCAQSNAIGDAAGTELDIRIGYYYLAVIFTHRMKLKVFYSWQSDLPNKTNRQFIRNSLEAALKIIHRDNRSISEYVIESDSRGESGTPELASTLFAKIDQCDIFAADVSIINSSLECRKVCNPNVLIELGYASSKLGWERILCIYNLSFGKIEELPFDIRHRKPIVYTADDKSLVNNLVHQFQSIIDNHINSKKYFSSVKQEIDLALQAILIDLTKIIFFEDSSKKYAYTLILHFSEEELVRELFEKSILGFQLFKNNLPHLQEFIEFYNNQVYLNFLNDNERRTLAKIILQFKDLQKIIADPEIYEQVKLNDKLGVVDATQLNTDNSRARYILVEKLDGEQAVVLDSGTFKKSQLSLLTFYYRIKPEVINVFGRKIYELSVEINEWIRITGDYFIFNSRLFKDQDNS